MIVHENDFEDDYARMLMSLIIIILMIETRLQKDS